MNKQRLLTLATYLETKVVKKHFDMRNFFCDHKLDRITPQRDAATRKKLMKHECGTTACALGYATMIPSFVKAGLIVDYNDAIAFEGAFWFGAASKFFDIDKSEVGHLFSEYNRDVYGTVQDSDRYKETPKQCAARIRKFVAWKEKQLKQAARLAQ